MVLKTFNVQQSTYNKFSKFCKGYGISMSKQIQLFMQTMTEKEPKVRKEYLRKLEKIRRGKFIHIKSFADRYRL